MESNELGDRPCYVACQWPAEIFMAEAISHAVYLRNRTWTRAIGYSTPYQLLHGQTPNVSGLQPWGCKVRVHDPSGTKLDGHSKTGRWLGFDPDTKDGHRIYWPDRQSVSAERSVRFNFNDETVVRVLPLEGEIDANEPNTLTTTPNEKSVEEAVETPADPVPVEGRGMRIRKELEYVQMLKDGSLGSAITGQGKTTLTKGMQSLAASTIPTVAEETVVEHAMASVIKSANRRDHAYL